MLLDEQRSHGPAIKNCFMYSLVVDMEYPVAWAIVSGPYPSNDIGSRPHATGIFGSGIHSPLGVVWIIRLLMG